MAMHDKGLTKLAEECGEVVQVAMKHATYPDNNHPDGTNLRERLQLEMGNLSAAIEFVVIKHNLDRQAIAERFMKKLALFQQWDNENDS